MARVFHVTAESNVDDIKSTGLQPSSSGSWRQKRKELRQVVDTHAEKHTSNWVKREDAVFFWTTVEDALDFIEQTTEYGDNVVILTVELTDTNLWAAESTFMEELYHSWMNNSGVDSLLQDLEQHTQKWNGSQQSGYEVWTQERISPQQIVDVS